MTTPNRIVIVGAGLAGAKAAQALRERHYQGTITLLGDETELPYERPPLSKKYLAGEAGFADAVVQPADWYREHDVELRTGVRVEALDRRAHEIVLTGGERLGYDKLVLATGAQPRRLDVPGADRALTLRRRADADAIRATFGPGRRLAVIGGGWIGLEVAAVARQAGTDVVLIESGELPLIGVLGSKMARVFGDLHREHGVDLRLQARVEEITATGVRLAGADEVAVDAVVLGVGVAPDVALAEASGLAVDNGVLVDAGLRTSDPDVYAVGDIANQDHPVLGTRVRVEHWANALNQPAVAAAGVLGQPARYENLPYFFSDQYDLGMEYVGYAPPGSFEDVVVRGDLSGREFVAFWIDGDHRIVAAMNVNVWDVVDVVKPLIVGRRPVDPGQLADPDVPIADL